MDRTFTTEEATMRNQSTPLSVLIDDYRVAIDAHLRPRTVVGYQKAIRELDTLMGQPTLADFTLDAVARVIARKRQTSASNARLIAAVAKVFSKWLYLTKLTDTHRLETLGVPAFNGRRTAFTDAEFSAILKAINALPNRTRKRDKALVLLAMGSGLRSNEIRTLHLNDLHLERCVFDLSDSDFVEALEDAAGLHRAERDEHLASGRASHAGSQTPTASEGVE